MKQRETTFRNFVMILTFIYSGISAIAFILFLITFLNDGNLFIFGRVAPQQIQQQVNTVKWLAGFMCITTGIGMVVSFLAGLALLRSQQHTIIREVDAVAMKKVEAVEMKAEPKVIEEKVVAKPVVAEEKKEEKKKAPVALENSKGYVDADVLLDDEKSVIRILQKHDGAMTQRDLSRESEFGKVKIHRLLKKLETKKIVTKYEFGMTNRIRLEKFLKE
jgi:uncharacterized membrane protein